MVGDLILDVNGQDIRKMAYNDVAFLLKTLPQGKVTLRIGRFKVSSSTSNSGQTSQAGTPSAQGSKQTSRRASLVNQISTTTVTICEQATVIAENNPGDNQNSSNIGSSKLTTFKPCLKK
jgi:C-terminal processing protease CtpA/Prc